MRPVFLLPASLPRRAALLAVALGLSACGGGGSAGPAANTSVDGAGPSAPPAPVAPPTSGGALPPPAPPADGGGDAPPPVPGDPTAPAVPGPAPGPVVLARLEGVRALDADAASGTVFAVDARGQVWRQRADDADPAPLWDVGALAVEGLAYAPQPNRLFLSVAGAHLAALDLDDLTLTAVGPLGAYASVKGLAFDPQAQRLYGVDADSRALLAIDMLDATVTLLGTLPARYSQVEGLSLDPVTRRLYGADRASGRLLEIDPATAAVAERTRLPRAAAAGLAYVVPGDRFALADPDAGEILLWDAKGNDIQLASVKGLDQDIPGRRVLGVHQGQAMLVEIDPVTGWKAWLGWIGVAGIESLAVDGAQGVAYGVDNLRKQLVRIPLAGGPGTVVGPLAGAAGAGSDVAGLAFDGVTRTLYGVDGTTGDLLRIDPLTGSAALVGVLPMGGVRALAFEPGAGVLHAFTSTQLHLTIDPVAFSVQATLAGPFGAVGGLAYDPEHRVLWGTEATASGLVRVWEPQAVTLGFREVRALATVGGQVLGFDQASGSLVRIDPATGRAALHVAVGPLEIEALALHPGTGRLLASDLRSGQLVEIDPAGGALTFLGALSATDVRGLAFDGSGVLYGVDRASHALVSIHPGNGGATPLADLAAHGLTDLQDLAWDASTQRLLAVDAAQRRLVEIDPQDGSVREIGALEGTDVRALLVEGPGVLLVVDRATERLLRVDRFTGATLP